jgi:hypothetical protein
VSVPEVFLEEEVVGGGDVVVLVGLYAPSAVIEVEVELGEPGEDGLVDGHAVVTDHDAAVEGDVVDLFAPGMRVDLLEAVAFAGVHIEDLLEKVLELGGDEVGQYVLA